VLGLLFSAFLFTACLWQLEIVEICAWEHRDFDWPFYLLPSTPLWIARDIFFAGIALAAVIEFVSLWWWT